MKSIRTKITLYLMVTVLATQLVVGAARRKGEKRK